jgi:hypothetical protein
MRTLVYGVSFLVMLGLSRTSLAQPMVPGGGQRPAVSPYINLLRGNNNINNAALGYYGIVRPEQQFRQQASQFQQQLSMTNQNLNSLASGEGEPTLITGKGATFMNYSHYFNNINGAGGAGSYGGRGSGMNAGASFGGGTAGGANTGARGSSGFTIGQAPQGGKRR